MTYKIPTTKTIIYLGVIKSRRELIGRTALEINTDLVPEIWPLIHKMKRTQTIWEFSTRTNAITFTDWQPMHNFINHVRKMLDGSRRLTHTEFTQLIAKNGDYQLW